MPNTLLTSGTTVFSTGINILVTNDDVPTPLLQLDAGSAANVAAYTNGAAVGRFYDSSPSANDAIQNIVASRGTFLTNQVNGRPCVSLDGLDDSYDLTNIVDASFFFFVGRKKTTNNANNSNFIASPTGSNFWLSQESVNNLFNNSVGNGVTTNRVWVGSQLIGTSPPRLVTTSTSWRLVFGEIIAGTNRLCAGLGRNADNSGFSNYEYAELRLYPALTDFQRITIQNEMLTKYAL